MTKVLNENDRVFEAYGTVEVRDQEGEIIPIEKELEPVLLTMMKRGGNIIDGHSNRVVGKLLNYRKVMKQVEASNGPKEVPAIIITGQIHNDYRTDDEVWEDIKTGQATGISFGGRAWKRTPEIINGKPTIVLGDIEGYEFTVVRPGRIPVNQESTLISRNMVAKSRPYNFAKMMPMNEVEKAQIWVKDPRVKGGGYYRNIEGSGTEEVTPGPKQKLGKKIDFTGKNVEVPGGEADPELNNLTGEAEIVDFTESEQGNYYTVKLESGKTIAVDIEVIEVLLGEKESEPHFAETPDEEEKALPQ